LSVSVENLQVKLFADGADIDGMLEMNSKTYIQGLTTNPTLMRKAGVNNYKEFAIEVLSQITEKPISFEVFSDVLEEMKRQALEIASWGENVYVKIPITNSKGVSTSGVIEFLVKQNVKVNVTALMTAGQVELAAKVLDPGIPSYVSVFAGQSIQFLLPVSLRFSELLVIWFEFNFVALNHFRIETLIKRHIHS
jgi:transaldolase